MHVERLQQLRRVVAEAPAERFDMAWICRRDHACGTAYCAAGWAVLNPWFQQETPILDHFMILYKSDRAIVTTKNPDGAFPGLAQVFGLELTDARDLFGGNLYSGSEVSQSEVIANIDRLLNGKRTIRYGVEDNDDE
jgi:hypothetical protein